MEVAEVRAQALARMVNIVSEEVISDRQSSRLRCYDNSTRLSETSQESLLMTLDFNERGSTWK
jgi:hypothetical protein